MLTNSQNQESRSLGIVHSVIVALLPCETATELAEAIAENLGHPEWLDDDTHVVWDVAAHWVPGA